MLTEEISEFTEELTIDVFTESRLPLQERVVDKLADIMFASDMILDLLRDERNVSRHRLEAVKSTVKGVYDTIDELMRQLTD
jgi:uncharacterized coiled-coil protein SlyX